MRLPDHFRFKHSSMDCFDCTAYRAESADRIQHMRASQPDLFSKYETRRAALQGALDMALK
jgi:hypothetical protein